MTPSEELAFRRLCERFGLNVQHLADLGDLARMNFTPTARRGVSTRWRSEVDPGIQTRG